MKLQTFEAGPFTIGTTHSYLDGITVNKEVPCKEASFHSHFCSYHVLD